MNSLDDAEVEYGRVRDPRINAITTPPVDESIRLPALWVIEAFTPAVSHRLEEGARKLQSDYDQSGAQPDFVARISQMRRSAAGGGWLNLGYIAPPPRARGVLLHLAADVPDGVHAVRASLVQPFPSTTILCCQFLLEGQLASSLEEPLREQYKTISETVGQGRITFSTVEQQKERAVALAREYVRSVCTEWLSRYFPGFFWSASGERSMPTCELLLLSQEASFGGLSMSLANPGFLQMLSLQQPPDLWECKELSGLWLQVHEGAGSHPARAAILGNVKSALAGEDIQAYGRTREDQIVHWLQDLDQTLATWALGLISRELIAQLATFRDALGALDFKSGKLKVSDVRELDQRFLRVQSEATSFAIDVARHCKDERRFMLEVYEFHRPLHPGGPQVRLFGQLRLVLEGSAAHLHTVEAQLEKTCTRTAGILAASVNEGMTEANLGLQRKIFVLTCVTAVLTALTVARELHQLVTWLMNW